jgi:flavodoxin I
MAIKCIMVYASMTGNTEEMANAIAEGVREAGATIDVGDILLADAITLMQFDAIILGAYTWGDGDLPDEFLDFYEEMGVIDLSGKHAAVFGSCDSSYEHFGNAVDILEQKLTERGAIKTIDSLKIEQTPTNEDLERCRMFGSGFVKKINQKV